MVNDPGTAAALLMADLCADALNVEPEAVEALHERAELLPALLAAILLELRTARAAPPAGPAPAVLFIAAVAHAWGADPFELGDLLRWAEAQPLSGRLAILDAARALLGLGADADLTAQQLGAALRRHAGKASGGYTLHCLGLRKGSRLWRARDSRDSLPNPSMRGDMIRALAEPGRNGDSQCCSIKPHTLERFSLAG